MVIGIWPQQLRVVKENGQKKRRETNICHASGKEKRDSHAISILRAGLFIKRLKNTGH